ncbi:DUF917 domain-containing protein [Phytoactinopolyspora alkaliphila]|uniref:DUF917 domain-containing protein n=1 Tax=Phytoactinopolyspora alkaliphila TaxID=1783498 RepID=A0A6N9YFM6_9ACTN|nr:DUF917 domain-containing protein [Phytoactinopolyspora alkaliphila]
MDRIGADDVNDLAAGAALLGSGGGGDPHVVAPLLHRAIEAGGPVPVVTASAIPAHSLVVGVVLGGTPAALADSPPGTDAARQALRMVERHVGGQAVAVLPISVGGMNALFAPATAGELGLPCVDADGMGRTLPRLDMTLFSLAGAQASPLAVVDVTGSGVVVAARTDGETERLARTAVSALGHTAVIAAYPMTAAACTAYAALGSLSYCRELGRRALSGPSGGGVSDDLLRFSTADVLFSGQVVDVTRTSTDGRMRGAVTVEEASDDGHLMRIDFQDQYLLATRDGVPVASAPDLIALIDASAGVPLRVDAIGHGRQVEVLVVPAHERWRDPDGLALAGPRAYGFDLPYVARTPTADLPRTPPARPGAPRAGRSAGQDPEGGEP